MKQSHTQQVLSGQKSIKLIRISEVSNLTTISKSHIYTLARQGKFPKPRKISVNTSVWLESEILQWMEEQLGISSEEVA
ncbi:MAG: AlpA family phage regulatory protein [Thiomicrorhabdus chilensis]|uniref:helix-turn-helix transcriptional regulator n=1 Tax=Thiomicrorhabdus chilensis TaxID=63656 RepID=UPI00299EDCFD|nr:AlpA family phage regulatory protein [Thiomicrorhabdus chilensis]MDX1346967.1 AlpA family phage regulatory protein [Thiomicrorhabdus chilensis]